MADAPLLLRFAVVGLLGNLALYALYLLCTGMGLGHKYALGYSVNFGSLFVFVDQFGLSHRLVQGVMTFLVAIVVFQLQRLYAFNARNAAVPFPSKPQNQR